MWGYLFNPKGSAQEMEQFPHVLRSNATAEERTDFPKVKLSLPEDDLDL